MIESHSTLNGPQGKRDNDRLGIKSLLILTMSLFTEQNLLNAQDSFRASLVFLVSALINSDFLTYAKVAPFEDPPVNDFLLLVPRKL